MLERDDETGDPSTEAKLAQACAVLEALEAVLDGEPVSDFMESFPLVQKAKDFRDSAIIDKAVANTRRLMELSAALDGKMVQDEFKNDELVLKAVVVSNRAEKWADYPVRLAEVKTDYGVFFQAAVYLKVGTEALEGWGLSRNKDRAAAHAFEQLSDRLHDYVRREASK